MIKKTREQLDAMSIKSLKSLDISSPDEEKMIQDIISSKSSSVIHQAVKFNQNKVPDIKNPEDEKEWQTKIDSFNSDHTPIEAKITEAEKVLGEVRAETVSETLVVPTVVQVSDGEIIKPFCDKCTSKGIRHKKDCPLYVPITKKDETINGNSSAAQ